MKVVVLGKGLMLANIVLGALDAGADVVGVFRYEETCNSIFKLFFTDLFSPTPDITLLKDKDINRIRFKSANSEDFRKLMITLNVDLIIVGTWREKIKKETFNIPKIATVNVHPSLLPKYRGPNPYLQTILHGEEYSGVSIHLMTDKFDEGPILKQEKVKIFENDTSKELKERCIRVTRRLVANFINDLNADVIIPVNQDEKYATYFPNISGKERMLDFKLQTSTSISRTVRALHPFLPCYITHYDKFFIVNPYHFKILDTTLENNPGDIIDKNYVNSSITIVCRDKKAIRFSGLKLYKTPKLTKSYIKNDIVVCSTLIKDKNEDE